MFHPRVLSEIFLFDPHYPWSLSFKIFLPPSSSYPWGETDRKRSCWKTYFRDLSNELSLNTHLKSLTCASSPCSRVGRLLSFMLKDSSFDVINVFQISFNYLCPLKSYLGVLILSEHPVYNSMYRMGHLKCYKLLYLKYVSNQKYVQTKVLWVCGDIRWYNWFDL